MTRFLLTTAVAGTLAAAAPAQFMPFGRPQAYNFGYAPAGYGNGVGFNYGGFSYNYYQTRQFSYSYNNPLLGYSGAVDLRFNYYGATRRSGTAGWRSTRTPRRRTCPAGSGRMRPGSTRSLRSSSGCWPAG